MPSTPHYTVGYSYAPDAHLTDDGLATWHVRDTATGLIVARFDTVTHARDWAALLMLDEERGSLSGPDDRPELWRREEHDHHAEVEAEFRELLSGGAS